MLNFQKYIFVSLFGALSVYYSTFTLSPRATVYFELTNEKYKRVPDLKKTSDIYKYKNHEIEPKWMHTGISMEYVPSQISGSIDVNATPEICNIDSGSLLEGQFSEKKQREAFKKIDHLSTKKIVREQDIHNPEAMSEKELSKTVFDSDIILQDIYASDNINQVLKHPLVTARLDRLEKYFEYKEAKAFRTHKKYKYNRARHFIKTIRSKEVEQLIDEIHHADFDTALKARNELAKKFRRDDKEYICDNAYPIKLLGFDIYRIVVDDFVTRPDYIMRLLGNDSLKEIEQFSHLCDRLQYKNDVAALAYLDQRLTHKLATNTTRNFNDEICSAIAERALKDPINGIIGRIRYGSWDESCAAISELEQHGGSAEPPRIMPGDLYMRKSLMHKSKYHRLAAAHKFQKARSDYSVRSTVENNINYQVNVVTPEPTKALNDLQPQVEQEIIMDSRQADIPQQESLQDLALKQEIFIPIDVQNVTIDILGNSNDYGSVAHGLEDVARHVLGNAYLCNVEYVADIQESIDKSLDIIRAPKNDVEFVFHVATVDHVLTDLQTQSEIVAEGRPSLWERTPGLLVRAATTFILRVNPVEQASEWGSLAKTGINLLGQGAYAVGDAAVHPVATAEKMYYATEKACEFVVNIARFTADSVNESYHLTPEERLQRMDAYWNDAQAIYKVIEPHLTAENFVDATATIAADIVAGKGFCCVYRYAKDLHVLGKMHKHATKMAKVFKQAVDTHLADNPVLVTAEGIVLKMSDGMKDFNKVPREIINSTKTLLESVYAPIAIELENELKAIVAELPNLPSGFARFANKPIDISLKHILGLEVNWTEKINELSKLSGFHHDLKGIIEKSGIIKFTRKIVDEHGCYSTILQVEGVRPVPKTFFPADWSRGQVVNKILEAYENFKVSGISPSLGRDGKYEILGLTREGIQIKMHITQDGMMKSAYPIVNGFGV